MTGAPGRDLGPLPGEQQLRRRARHLPGAVWVRPVLRLRRVCHRIPGRVVLSPRRLPVGPGLRSRVVRERHVHALQLTVAHLLWASDRRTTARYTARP